MLISLSWLHDFINIPSSLSPHKIGELLTLHTAEVEQVIDQAAPFQNMVIGKITGIKSHPHADKLHLCFTDTGDKIRQIVCGAPNVRVGMLVPVALEGALVRWHGEGNLVPLRNAEIRGQFSEGMICAGEEIGLAPSLNEGIVDLTHLKKAPGTPLATALDLDDAILEIENKSLTHRPDLWGHYGIARELAAILGIKLKPLFSENPTLPEPENIEPLSIQIEKTQLCPRYQGIIVSNLHIGPSPNWLTKRLEAINIRPICNIVDITNYVMAELGQPLHAFDRNKIEKAIIVRTAHSGEKFQTLDGQERDLDSQTLVIADHEKTLAIAGIIGGLNSEINADTTSIIIESANFNPIAIRQTATRLGLRTEAVQRFEKGLDPLFTGIALTRTLQLIKKICPQATLNSEIVDINHTTSRDIKIPLEITRANSKIGKNLTSTEIKKILQSLEFTCQKGAAKNSFLVQVPSFRAQGDIATEDDLIEEIARLYGYENLSPQLPPLPIRLPLKNWERTLKHQARSLLSNVFSLTEVYNYSFYSRSDFEKCQLKEELHFPVQNYLSEDQTHMRLSLLPKMLKALQNNLKRHPQLKFFEFGRSYQKIKLAANHHYWPLEEKKLLIAIIDPRETEIFYTLKGITETFLNRLGFAQQYYLEQKPSPHQPTYLHPGKYQTIFVSENGVEKYLGRLFELAPQIAQNFEIEQKVGIIEINFAPIFNQKQPLHDTSTTYLSTMKRQISLYHPIPKFPGNSFDVSVTIPNDLSYEQIHQTIAETAPQVIESIELFDLYTGEKIPRDTKNFAFHILLQSSDHVITDQEMAEIQKKVFTRLKQAGGEIRGEMPKQ